MLVVYVLSLSPQVVGSMDIIFSVPYPMFYRRMLGWISLIELNLIAFMPVDCAVNITFHHKLVLQTALPIVVIGCLLAVARYLKLRAARVRDAAAVDMLGELGVGSSLNSLCFFLVFLLYPSCAATTFGTFICTTLDDDSRYLRLDPSIDCNDPTHKLMQVYAGIMIAIWPLGVPMLYMGAFWWFWPRISELRRSEMRQAMKGSLHNMRRGSVKERSLLDAQLCARIELKDKAVSGDTLAPEWAVIVTLALHNRYMSLT